jgi:polygalacturonase
MGIAKIAFNAVQVSVDPQSESNAPFESYQDFGHNHWHNSLIWGEGIHDVIICGPGLICGDGLARGETAESGRPAADTAGAADKVIALIRCRNITVSDIAILAAGPFWYPRDRR